MKRRGVSYITRVWRVTFICDSQTFSSKRSLLTSFPTCLRTESSYGIHRWAQQGGVRVACESEWLQQELASVLHSGTKVHLHCNVYLINTLRTCPYPGLPVAFHLDSGLMTNSPYWEQRA